MRPVRTASSLSERRDGLPSHTKTEFWSAASEHEITNHHCHTKTLFKWCETQVPLSNQFMGSVVQILMAPRGMLQVQTTRRTFSEFSHDTTRATTTSKTNNVLIRCEIPLPFPSFCFRTPQKALAWAAAFGWRWCSGFARARACVCLAPDRLACCPEQGMRGEVHLEVAELVSKLVLDTQIIKTEKSVVGTNILTTCTERKDRRCVPPVVNARMAVGAYVVIEVYIVVLERVVRSLVITRIVLFVSM